MLKIGQPVRVLRFTASTHDGSVELDFQRPDQATAPGEKRKRTKREDRKVWVMCLLGVEPLLVDESEGRPPLDPEKVLNSMGWYYRETPEKEDT